MDTIGYNALLKVADDIAQVPRAKNELVVEVKIETCGHCGALDATLLICNDTGDSKRIVVLQEVGR